MSKIIRPKGVLYIIYISFKLVCLMGVLSFSILFIMNGHYLYLLAEVCPLILFILQVREIIRYKIIITDEYLWIAANRDLFLVRHKDLKIKYDNLISMQYLCGVYVILISDLRLRYSNRKREMVLNMVRFSQKQIEEIMRLIKINADKYNGYEVEIKPSLIQDKTVKIKHK